MKAYLLLLCLVLLAFAQKGVEVDSNDDDELAPPPQEVRNVSFSHTARKICPNRCSEEVRSMRKICLRLLRK